MLILLASYKHGVGWPWLWGGLQISDGLSIHPFKGTAEFAFGASVGRMLKNSRLTIRPPIRAFLVAAAVVFNSILIIGLGPDSEDALFVLIALGSFVVALRVGWPKVQVGETILIVRKIVPTRVSVADITSIEVINNGSPGFFRRRSVTVFRKGASPLTCWVASSLGWPTIGQLMFVTQGEVERAASDLRSEIDRRGSTDAYSGRASIPALSRAGSSECGPHC